MTIKEIEVLSGITRANIRYYEHEGLISPLRAGNDYRDYSDDDLAALLKIRLLRQLHVPLDDIRGLQSGEFDLCALLDQKLKELERGMPDLKNASEICRDIRANDTNYTTLDARRYLSWISDVAPSGADYFSIRADEQSKAPYPWRRYFARSMDYTCYYTIWTAICYFVLRWNPIWLNSFEILILALVPYGIMLILEPILLATLGTTPGKWIFGLQVRGTNGNKLSLTDAWNRTCLMFAHGMGYFIPLYSIYSQYVSYIACRDNGELLWDEDLAYSIKDKNATRIAAFILAYVLLIALVPCITFQAQMPRHRGDLTIEEFALNFNDLMDFNQLSYGMQLNSHGQWKENTSDGTNYMTIPSEIPLPEFEYTVTNGNVTKVFFEVSTDQVVNVFDNSTSIISLAIRSYVCAQKGMNFINQLPLLSGEYSAFSNFTFTKAGITVICHVEFEGYDQLRPDVLIPRTWEKQYYHLEFTMEKTE